jgi:hypothetical protein
MNKWHTRNACWTPKATNTHYKVLKHLLRYHSNNGCTNAHQYHAIRTLPVLLFFFSLCNNFSIGISEVIGTTLISGWQLIPTFVMVISVSINYKH